MTAVAHELDQLRADLDAVRGAYLSALDALDHERAWSRAMAEAAYRAGQADGWRAGFGASEDERAEAWRRVAGPVAHGVPREVIERNRWHVCCLPCRRGGHRAGCGRCEDRTRETFGRAHPDDLGAVERRGAA